ncbi:hypothetical protein ACI784_17410 [Geodermatophilus sp. SYSU D01186]
MILDLATSLREELAVRGRVTSGGSGDAATAPDVGLPAGCIGTGLAELVTVARSVPAPGRTG